MKRLFISVMVFIMLLTLAACSEQDPSATKTTESSVAQSFTEGITTSLQVDEDGVEDPLEWGVMDQYTAETAESFGSYYINFPHYTGISSGYAMIADQLDGTMVLISGQNMDAPEINNVSELFPAYFDQVQYTLEGYYGLFSGNYTFALQNTDSTVVNGYEMYTFSGTIAFDYEQDDIVERCEYQFISYATTLKSNGGYAFWVVYDNSEDQSNGELIAQHALNMAKTFREER